MQTLTELYIAQPLFEAVYQLQQGCTGCKVVFSYQVSYQVVFFYSYSLFKIIIPHGTNNYGGQGLAVKKISRMQFP